jgi:hypothetical protein
MALARAERLAKSKRGALESHSLRHETPKKDDQTGPDG